MKIAVIIPQSKLFGGGPRISLELARNLAKLGHSVTPYSFAKEKGEALFGSLTAGLQVKVIQGDPPLKSKSIFRKLPGTSTIFTLHHEHVLAKLLAREIDHDTDAIIATSTRGAYLVGHYFKKMHRSIPLIWQMNDLVTLVQSRCRIDMFGKTHCSPGREKFYAALDMVERKLFLPSVDEISVLAEKVRIETRRDLHRDATVIRTGVNAEQFQYKKRSIPKGTIRLLSHAQFFTHRRFEDAIEAVALLLKRGYNVSYTISGDCETYRSYRDYRGRLEALARSLRVHDRIIFRGKISEEDLLREYYNAHIFLYPNYLQSWGLVVFEAMATGLPAIVSRESGAHEVLTDRENALLIPAKNPEALAAATQELIDQPNLYAALSEHGAEFVRREIRWDHFAKGILKLIEKHLHKTRT